VWHTEAPLQRQQELTVAIRIWFFERLDYAPFE
jgi:hypothetical protein